MEDHDTRVTVSFSDTTVKVISRDKEFVDQLIQCLSLAFDCKTTSPKMYNAEKDIFFQFIAVSRRA